MRFFSFFFFPANLAAHDDHRRGVPLADVGGRVVLGVILRFRVRVRFRFRVRVRVRASESHGTPLKLCSMVQGLTV